jgi:hypothetical protein
LLIERMNLEHFKIIRDNKEMYDQTIILEFSRGKEHGGFKSAFSHLSKSILEKAAILYVDVSWAESLRKNRKRFNPEKPDSILEHSLSDEKMIRLYRDSDWDEIASISDNRIHVGSISVPFVVFENEDDVTSGNTDKLDQRLQSVLERLWKIY